MAIFNVINFTQLEGALRMEAEFYKPDDLIMLNKLRSLGSKELGNYCIFIKKGIFDLPPSYYTSDGIPLIRTTEIKSMIADLSSVARIPFSIHSFHLKTELEAKDIVFTKIGANIGDISILPSTEKVYNFSQNVAGAKIDRKKIMPEYLVCFLSTKYGRFQIKRIQMLSGQGKLELVDIKKILILPASYELQKNIADIYNLAENFLVLAKEQYVQAEQLLLSELGLHDWKPRHTLTYVRSFSQVAKASRMDAEHFHPKYKEMFDRLPSNVYLQLLGKITLYTKGIEVGSSAYTESGIPFLRVSNLSKHGIVDDTVNFISNELYNVLREKYEPQQGEILLSKDATPGIAYFLDESVQGIIASGILRLSLIEDIPPYYLELVLNSIFVQLQIEQSVGGSIIKHWKPSQVQKTWIPRLLADREKEISALVQQSHAARREAKTLLEKAKRAVEIAIEEGEERAMEYLNR